MSDKPAKIQSFDVLTKDQAVLVDEVKVHHDGVRRSHENTIKHAFLAGVNLIALKDSVPHGNKNGDGFMAIREKFLPDISRSGAQRYMEFVRLLESKLPTVGNIRLQLMDGQELKEPEVKAVTDAVYEYADGKTWTAFYRDLNLSKQREKGGFHPPTADLLKWLEQNHVAVLTDHKTPYPLNQHITFEWLKANYPDIAAAFKKQWKPKAIPSDVIAEGHRREGRKLLALITETLDEKKRTAAFDESLRTELKTAAFELWKAMKASLKGRSKQQKGQRSNRKS